MLRSEIGYCGRGGKRGGRRHRMERRKFTEEEDWALCHLLDRWAAGRIVKGEFAEVATEFGRTESAIKNRVSRLRMLRQREQKQIGDGWRKFCRRLHQRGGT